MSKGSEQGKLFVGGLSWDTDKDGLQGYFSRFGKVIDCIVMKNNITGKSRGFGFVTYEDPACVETVLSSGTHHLDGRQVDPKACNPKGSQPPRGPRNDSGGGRGGPNMRRGGGGNDKSRKIFVGGLPNSADEEALKAAFSRFGTVTDVVIMFDQQKNRSRGFGFLTFENEDSVEAVVKDRYVDVCNKQVECKRAEPRNENRDGGNWGAPGGNQWNHGGPHGHQGGGYGGGGYQDFNQGGGNNFNQFQGGYGQQQGWGPQGGQGGYGNQPPQGNYQSPPQGGPPQQGGFNQWQQSPQPSGPPPQGPNSGNYGYGTPAAQSYGTPQQPAAAPAHAPAQQSFGDYGYGNTQTPAAAPPTDPAAAQNTGYNYGNQYGNMGNYQQDQSSYGPTRGYQQPQANGAAQGYNQAAYTAPQQGGYSTDGMSGYAGAQNTSYGQGDAGGAGGYGSPPQNRMPPAATSPVGGYHPYRRT